MKKKKQRTNNKAFATVEISIIMLVYMTVIMMCFQSFFLLLSGAGQYKDELGQDADCSIEQTVKNMRRWQFIE